MRADWRTLPAWPHPAAEKTRPSLFRTSWERSLEKLAEEVERSGGDDLLISIVATPDQLSLAGRPRAGLKVLYRGVEVSFEREDQRVAFHVDAFPHLHDNIHAIALTLEALRAVDRYGATTGAEQYAGFAMLGAGAVDPDHGRRLVEAAGSIKAALRVHHPDHGGNEVDFLDVDAYRKQVGA